MIWDKKKKKPNVEWGCLTNNLVVSWNICNVPVVWTLNSMLYALYGSWISQELNLWFDYDRECITTNKHSRDSPARVMRLTVHAASRPLAEWLALQRASCVWRFILQLDPWPSGSLSSARHVSDGSYCSQTPGRVARSRSTDVSCMHNYWAKTIVGSGGGG